MNFEQKAQTSEAQRHVLMTAQGAAVAAMWTTQEASRMEPKYKRQIFSTSPWPPLLFRMVTSYPAFAMSSDYKAIFIRHRNFVLVVGALFFSFT